MKRLLTALILSMVFVFGAVGFAGCGDKGDTGAKGDNGKSAYQIWLDNGHTGTEADFLEWLKGDNGKTPLLMINDDGYWEVSYDNGETYTVLAPAYADIAANRYFTFTAYDSEDTAYKIEPKDVADMPENLVLPAYYNGKPVTAIKGRTFNNCTSIKSVKIPSTITFIPNYAFEGCTSLESVIIQGAVQDIQTGTFDGCTALKSIELSEGVQKLNNYAFQECPALESVIIPKSVTFIGYAAFYGSLDLDTITYNGTVAEWNAIVKDINWKINSAIAHIHCLADDQTIDL